MDKNTLYIDGMYNFFKEALGPKLFGEFHWLVSII